MYILWCAARIFSNCCLHYDRCIFIIRHMDYGGRNCCCIQSSVIASTNRYASIRYGFLCCSSTISLCATVQGYMETLKIRRPSLNPQQLHTYFHSLSLACACISVVAEYCVFDRKKRTRGGTLKAFRNK